jgi:branched-chain amino acid transport system ATP-binding protein
MVNMSATHQTSQAAASSASSSATPVMTVAQIEVLYNGCILALRGISLEVRQGQTVALLGPNGAGKSTTLKSMSRLIEPDGGAIAKGTVLYNGVDITGWDAYRAVKEGIVQVLEGRQVFPQLTVEENLLVPAYSRGSSRREVAEGLEKIYEYFPRLKTRRSSRAGFTSGGEQQMVAIGRALMLKPRVILLDEPSMGLAPLVVEEIFEILAELNKREAVSFLLAEQNASIALRYADYGYVIESGRLVLSGEASELRARDDVKEMYLGTNAAGDRQDFRNVKCHQRRKRNFGM